MFSSLFFFQNDVRILILNSPGNLFISGKQESYKMECFLLLWRILQYSSFILSSEGKKVLMEYWKEEE